MKIASIVGARPNFIKCAPLSVELRKDYHEVLIHTGQHYDYEMNKVFFEELNIPEPDYHLGVGSGNHGEQTGEMLKRIEEVLIKEKPDLVLAFGDTNSTLAGALAASKLHITVAHVEAGLRSFDRRMPEEINRVLTDHCSDLLFCPTETAVDNLKREGIEKGVYLTGDVMVDALKENIEIAEKKSMILDGLSLKPKDYYLATLHRAENTDDLKRLKNIVDAFCEIENLIFPCHPRTEKCLKQFGLWDKLTRKIKVIKPVGYLDMLMLEKNAKKILTDSGGVQKEAYIFKVPCITLRENTEWVETVEDGWNVLVGANKEKIVKMANDFEPKGEQRGVFGSGDASQRITESIKEMLEREKLNSVSKRGFMTKSIELKYYDQKEVWKRYDNNITEIKRAKKVINLIPDYVKSVLDIGCGNGIVTNIIEKPFVVGLDFAKIALAQVKTNVIQASIDKLPIKSKKFDLIILTEVLEHLDDGTYIKALNEIRRLKAKYLLITVPFNENIELGLCKCSACGNLFNASHHYRKFDNSWFNKEFSEFEREKIEYASYGSPTNEKLIFLKHKFGVYSYSDVAVCNKCGNRPIRPNRILRYIFGGLNLLDSFIKRIFKIQRPYHQMVLLRRRSSISEGDGTK